VGLRSVPARYLFLDEVDGYLSNVEGEVDSTLLAERRSATFQRRKIPLVLRRIACRGSKASMPGPLWR
jgi:phage terminase large subunit GpA-like protein